MNSKDLKRFIRLSPVANSRLYHLLRFYMKRSGMDAVMKKAGITSVDEKNMASMMKTAMVKYRWDYDECVMYHYAELTDSERKSFVPEYEKNIFCDRVNDGKQAKIFDSKWKSYCHFKDYYHRDCVRVEDTDDLQHFFKRHRDFIVKPDSAACGRGITVFHAQNERDANSLIDRYLIGGGRPRSRTAWGGYIVEELIVNAPIMQSLHPSSLNTVRIPTVRYDNRVEVIHPFLRVGRGSSVVDNAGSGGIMGNIDVATGRVYAAADELGREYKTHPDTGVSLIGFTIPKWQEALTIVKQMAQVVPSVRYVGWDMALTPKGWVMIEGNDKGQFIWQVADRKGFRDEFEKIKKELVR